MNTSISISLDDTLVPQIDERVLGMDLTRSQYIRRLIRRDLADYRLAGLKTKKEADREAVLVQAMRARPTTTV